MDVYDGPAGVLLWHGSGPNERGAMQPLAEAIQALGVGVLVPDWDSTAPDGGRADLIGSVGFARRRGARVLVGWSLGGTAAVATGLTTDYFRAVVSLAGSMTSRDPISGAKPLRLARRPAAATRLWLVHGSDDDTVPARESRRLQRRLGRHDWTSTLHLVATDHAGIVLTGYDERLDRCVREDSAYTRAGGAATLAAIESALRS